MSMHILGFNWLGSSAFLGPARTPGTGGWWGDGASASVLCTSWVPSLDSRVPVDFCALPLNALLPKTKERSAAMVDISRTGFAVASSIRWQ